MKLIVLFICSFEMIRYKYTRLVWKVCAKVGSYGIGANCGIVEIKPILSLKGQPPQETKEGLDKDLW